MKVQLYSDLHLESEDFDPQPLPGADLLVLAGDIDSTWSGYARFARWPVPVLAVAGNHEFDGRELDDAWPALREHCERLGIRLLEREAVVVEAPEGRRIRFVATIRWCDFDLYGPAQRERALRSGAYFQRVMGAMRGGQPFDALAVRDEGLACRAWLQAELARDGPWDATVAITHFAPSLLCGDPRYGAQPSTACFCNADDDLLPRAQVWLHGHVHVRHDVIVSQPQGEHTRIVSQARGIEAKGEVDGYDAGKLIEL